MAKKKTKVEEKPVEELDPKKVLEDFIARNQGENRHTRRMMGKMVGGLKIIGTNKPIINNEKRK